MRPRHVLGWSLAILGALALVLVALVVSLTDTDWGRERVRTMVESRLARALGGRVTLHIGRLSCDFAGRLEVRDVTLADSTGRVLVSAERVELRGSLAGLARGRVRLSRLVVEQPFVSLEQYGDGSWNLSHFFSGGEVGVSALPSGVAATADTVEVRSGRFLVLALDTVPTLPRVAYEFRDVAVVLLRVRSGGPEGGEATLARLALELNRPPVSLRDARGRVRWSSDSVAIDVPRFQVSRSTGAVRGTVALRGNGRARLDLVIDADSVALEDVRWVSAVIPPRGTGSAVVRIRSAGGAAGIAYDVADLDLRATGSHLTGRLTVLAGRRAVIRDLELDAQPLDLALVREVFGDTVLRPGWRGTLTGRLSASGGPLDSLRLDTVVATFDDARVPGARSSFRLSGTANVLASVTELRGMAVEVVSLDVRTLGAIAKAADSLHGTLAGHLELEGPTRDLRFHSLVMVHADGDRPRSAFRGEGRLATDPRTKWLEATIALDSVAVATVLRDRTMVPLQGRVRGTLDLQAVLDTLSFDARLYAGRGDAQLTGVMLLDSTRTWLRARGNVRGFDPRTLIAQPEIPAMVIGGAMEVDLDERPGTLERHVTLELDTTTVIGEGRDAVSLSRSRLMFGVDSTGFHVDTAEVRSRHFTVRARGRLALRGEARDSLTFEARFDSLAVLTALLRDSTGAPLADSLAGSALAAGSIVGSFESAALRVDVGGENVRSGALQVRRGAGRVDVRGLPKHAEGLVTLVADSAALEAVALDRVSIRADIENGGRARVSAVASGGDTLRASAAAVASRRRDTITVSLDSLDLSLRELRLRLLRPSRLEMAPRALRADTILIGNERGGTIAASGALVSDTIRATLRVRSLGIAGLPAPPLALPDVSGLVSADVTVGGTRDSPAITFEAALDSVRVSGRERPSLSLSGTYDARRLRGRLAGRAGAREALSVSGEVPVDLALRALPARRIEQPLRLEIRADSASLADLEGLVPGVSRLAGTLGAQVTLQGTWSRLTGIGFAELAGGAFELREFGFAARAVRARLEFAGDTVRVVRLEMTDADRAPDGARVEGVIFQAQREWRVQLHSTARAFRLADDPHFVVAEADWNVDVTGPLRAPRIDGDVTVPHGVLVIGEQRRVLALPGPTAGRASGPPFGTPIAGNLRVTLGNDVRLRSREANVQLAGTVDAAGPLFNPYLTGEIAATRGTYRVDLGVLKRTFRVDSGTVLLDGLRDDPAILNIWTSYVVRRADRDDVHIGARLYGTSDQPRLQLTSDLGSAVAQSEIISYLVFGQPTFQLDGGRQRTVRTATAALVPSLGGLLEGVLGTLLPFFHSLQVTTLVGEEPSRLISDPLDGLLNSFAVIGGRQIGSDSFFSLSGGVCRGSRLSSGSSSPFWFGVAAEYRPRRHVGAALSMDPGPAPCSRVGSFVDSYQFGVDLFRDWSIGDTRRP